MASFHTDDQNDDLIVEGSDPRPLPTSKAVISMLVGVLVMLVGLGAVFNSNLLEESLDTRTQALDEQAVQTDGSLIPNFPAMPIYPGFTLIESIKTSTEENDNDGYEATWTTQDSVPQVAQWYVNQLPIQGWAIDIAPADINNPKVQFVSAVNDGELLHLSLIGEASGKTRVTVNFPGDNSGEEEGEEE